jgi:hypothetical protein
MIQRCYNPNNNKYEGYGGRGITVCNRWRFGENGKTPFECFLEDMGERPSPEYSIDRKNNSGNYEPSNCRWATRKQQQTNKRITRNNTSGYMGVRRDKKTSKWYAQVTENHRTIRLGTYTDKVEGAKAFDRWVIANRDEYATTNFPRSNYLD